MSLKGCGSSDCDVIRDTILKFPGGTEENYEKYQSRFSVYRPKFKQESSQIQSKIVTGWTNVDGVYGHRNAHDHNINLDVWNWTFALGNRILNNTNFTTTYRTVPKSVCNFVLYTDTMRPPRIASQIEFMHRREQVDGKWVTICNTRRCFWSPQRTKM